MTTPRTKARETRMVSVDHIHAYRNPRTDFPEEDTIRLAANVDAVDIGQPPQVRPKHHCGKPCPGGKCARWERHDATAPSVDEHGDPFPWVPERPTPCSITPETHQEYWLVDGERRSRTAKYLGRKTIEVVIDTEITAEKAFKTAVALGAPGSTKDLTPYQLMRVVINKRKDRPGTTYVWFEREMGIPTKTARECVELHEKLKPSLLEYLRMDDTPDAFKHLVTTARVPGSSPEDAHRKQQVFWDSEGYNGIRPGRPKKRRSSEPSNDTRRNVSSKMLNALIEQIERTNRIAGPDGPVTFSQAQTIAVVNLIRWVRSPIGNTDPRE